MNYAMNYGNMSGIVLMEFWSFANFFGVESAESFLVKTADKYLI
jgi:hypothetical protein